MGDVPQLASVGWDDLTEVQPFETMTPIEQDPEQYGLTLPENWLNSWLNIGVVALKLGKDPAWMAALDAYAEQREKLPMDRSQRSNYWHGWHFPCSYLACGAMLDVGLDPFICDALRFMLGDEPLLHLALTGWVSTERNWHQDSYLNPPNVWSKYLAVWIAIDDITEDSGPFEFVPGSHRWEVMRQDKLFKHLPRELIRSPDWPSITQKQIARICEDKIKAVGAKSVKYLPKKGDVLIWHSNLLHRGTEPTNPEALRKSLILHYSALSSRPDMGHKVQYGGGYYFNGPTDGSVRMMK